MVAFGLAGVPGSLLGSAINKRMDADVLLLAFSVLIVIAAWRMVTGCPTCTKVGEEAASRPAPEAARRAAAVRSTSPSA